MTSNVTRLAQDALAHQHAGRIDIALEMFTEVLRDDPRHPQANFSLGIAAYQAGQIGTAIDHLKTAAAKARKHPKVHELLGLALLNSGDLKGARSALKKAVTLAPEVAEYHAALGDVYRLQRKPVLSRQCFERALKLEPKNGLALLGMGQLEVSLGNIDAALELFEKTVASGQEQTGALYRLAFTQTHTERPAILETIETLLGDDSQRAAPDQADLHWAAGKIHYDLGDTPHAAEHYRTARRLRYDPFDQAAHEERLSFMKGLFTSQFFEDRTEVADPSNRPIFIFGMPRSGTTLAEQILARHTDVASGGELLYFRNLQRELGLMGPPSPALERRLQELDPRALKRIAKGYLHELDAIDKRTPHVTDKMPHNFEMLWLMALLFPGATFIHCDREPADVCVSLLSHALSPAHNYCRTQKSAGAYFQSYANLMRHWEQVLPVQLHTLSYETLVWDQELQSRQLLEHAGLPWQAECLEFYKGDAPVTTFSDLQVRRPMFSSSIGRWKRHKGLLGDLFEALGPLAPKEIRAEVTGSQRTEDAFSRAWMADTHGLPANDALQDGKSA
ncbi:tetratricopeptide repeat-containing sulfotransferase family protein [Roseibium sp.]|uniref:tetratricopeptide repeat-containing sulfotransferase family protein n=1 Tax=Roseibium sp. TaxID=1936156 RepID=UPI003A98089D